LPPSNKDVRIYYQVDLPVTFSDGTTGTYRLAFLSQLGMGRVQAANATSDAIRQWHPHYVLLVGIAGGITEAGVQPGDVLISDQIVDYELQKLTHNGGDTMGGASSRCTSSRDGQALGRELASLDQKTTPQSRET